MRKIASLKHRRHSFSVEVIPWVFSTHHAEHQDEVLSSRKKSHGSTVEHVKNLPLMGPLDRQQGADVLEKDLHIMADRCRMELAC